MFTVCVLQARLSDLEDELELFRPNTRSDSHVLESVLSLRELIKLEKIYNEWKFQFISYTFFNFEDFPMSMIISQLVMITF